MVTLFYLIVFIISLVMAGRVLRGGKKVDTMLVMAVILIVLSCGGRYALATADSLEMALYANIFIYIGACYLPLLIVRFMARVSNKEMPRLVWGALLAASTFIMVGVLTIGRTDWYYKSVALSRGDGYSYLVKEYSAWHTLYYVLLAIYAAVMLYYVINAVNKRKQISVRLVTTVCGVTIFTFLFYLIEKVAKLNVSILSIGYLIGIAMLIAYYRRLDMYDMSANIANSVERMKEYGYIAFDDKYQYIKANTYIAEIFPEIKSWIVDRKVPVSDSFMYTEVIKTLLDWDGKEDAGRYIKVNDKYFYLDIRYISYGKNIGYLLEFVDKTMEKQYYNTIEEYNATMEKEVLEKTRELREQKNHTQRLFIQTVTALSEAVDAKDRYTSGHSKRVARYSKMIAANMGKSREEQENIYRAGLLHDVGKIRIPNSIINKKDRLTDEEYNTIKLHSVTGYHILKGISDDGLLAVAAKHHHERYDGNGYPNGLSGDMIPQIARILAVADSYDAMTSNRSYRKALPQAVVREEILKGKGSQFDPAIADIMLDMIDKDTEYCMRQPDDMQKYVLVVDDELINHKLLTHIMQDEPMYTINSAMSGEEALKCVESAHYDLILIDARMPDMDGLDTLKRIRELTDTPVALMTGDRNMETFAEFERYGCDDYITKPFLPLVMKELIHNMTEKTQVEDI